MTERAVSLATLLSYTRQLTKETLYSALPGAIVAYDPATQRADIKPQLKFTLRDEFAGKEMLEDLPTICDVPIMFPRFGEFMMTMPVAVDDTVLLVFCDRSIDKWKTNGGNVDPIDLRSHDISDAVAIPGLYPKPEVLPSTLTSGMALGKIGDTTLQIHIDGTSINLGGPGAVEFIAKAAATDAQLSSLYSQFSTFVSAVVASLTPIAAAFSSAGPVVSPGSPTIIAFTPLFPTGPLVLTPPSSVAATKAKVL